MSDYGDNAPETMADVFREAYREIFEECGISRPDPFRKKSEVERARKHHNNCISTTLQDIFDEE